MTLAVVVVSVIVGGLILVGMIAGPRQEARKLEGGTVRDCAIDVELIAGDVDSAPDVGLASDDELLHADYAGAWQALEGGAARMRLLAAASEQLAQRCRRDSLAGAAPARMTFAPAADYQLPRELELTAARPGEPERWQALDRALRRLSAIYEDDDASLHADAHEQISLAAGELADDLAQQQLPVDLDHCWFCGADGNQRLLAGDHASICDDCVQACHDLLHD